MLESQLNKLLSLPEVKFIKRRGIGNHTIQFEAYKTSPFEVCPKCASKTSKVFDHIFVNIKDTPIRDKIVF